jgi:hypothetical protein
MYVFPASHFKVHVALSRAMPGSKVFFPGFFVLCGIHFALGGVSFSPLADENSMTC